jgi:alkylation response protein AidB-like acyl-CoA dehydrogenase
MDELLTAEQSQLRESAARLCADLGGTKRARKLRDAAQEIDADAWRAIHKAGWLATLVPEERGGLGLGAAEFYVLLEQIGRQTLMVPLLEAASMSWLLGRVRTGSDEALQSLLAGDRLIIPALQADGWDFQRASKVLEGRYEGNELHLSGSVAGVPFVQSADEFLLRAEIAGKGLLCLVARDNPGCKISTHRNVDGSTASTIALVDAVIDEGRIVAHDEEAEALAARMADLLALGASIELLGLAETAHAMTLDHVKTRKQFGHPLGSFQALQHRMVDGFVDLELDRALLHRISLAWDAGTALPAMVAAAKSRASRNTAEIMRTGLQLHGAIGYTDEHDIGIFFKRALVLAARYGNEFMQLDRFARLTKEEA